MSMFKDKKAGKILAFLILGLFMFSFLAGVVSAQDTARRTRAQDTVTDFFNSLLEGWKEGRIDNYAAKVFLFFIVFILIALLLSFIPVISKQKVLSLVLSLVIAFLATAYITPQEIQNILTSYTALGLTITTMLPLLLLAGLTYNAITHNDPTLALLQHFAWGLFGIFSLYRFIWLGWFSDLAVKEGKGALEILGGSGIIILIVTVIAVLVFIFNSKIREVIGKSYMKEIASSAETTAERATRMQKILSRELEETAKGS